MQHNAPRRLCRQLTCEPACEPPSCRGQGGLVTAMAHTSRKYMLYTGGDLVQQTAERCPNHRCALVSRTGRPASSAVAIWASPLLCGSCCSSLLLPPGGLCHALLLRPPALPLPPGASTCCCCSDGGGCDELLLPRATAVPSCSSCGAGPSPPAPASLGSASYACRQQTQHQHAQRRCQDHGCRAARARLHPGRSLPTHTYVVPPPDLCHHQRARQAQQHRHGHKHGAGGLPPP